MATNATLRPGAIALVTGASSGIGKAITEGLLDRQVRVICAARRRKALEEVFGDRGEQVLLHSLDVTDADAVTALGTALPEPWRDIDILVANAGSDVGGRKRFDEGSIEHWVQTIETNVTGVFRVCHAIIPGMIARRRGHVVTLGSTAGLDTYPGGAAYATSKHAIHGFSDLLRHDYKREPLRITEIMPGMVRTGFATARHQGDEAKGQQFYDDWPATMQPEDIAAAALFALEQPDHVNVAAILVTPTGDK